MQASPDLPQKALPLSWQNYIIWILALVILILAGYIAKQFGKKHDEAMKKFDGLIKSTDTVNTSLTNVGTKLEKIFDNDRETKWALQNQSKDLTSIHTELEMLSQKTETNTKAITANTTAVNKLSKKLKCQEETA